MRRPRKTAAQLAETRTRRCLRCREGFESDGAHHRVCNRCKSSRSWREGTPLQVAHGWKTVR